MSTTKDKPEAATGGKSFAETAPKNIPRVEPKENVATSTTPVLEDFDDIYIRKSDGEPYALAVYPEDGLGRTHKAANTLHYWEGTEEQFRANFTNEDGSRIHEAKPSIKK